MSREETTFAWVWSTAQQLLPDSNLPHETLIGSGDSSASSIVGESHTQQIALSVKVKSFRGLFGCLAQCVSMP